jgi:hypothetical protein
VTQLQLGKYYYFYYQILTLTDLGFIPSPDAKAKGGRGQQAIRLNVSRSALLSQAPFGILTEIFRDFTQL